MKAIFLSVAFIQVTAIANAALVMPAPTAIPVETKHLWSELNPHDVDGKGGFSKTAGVASSPLLLTGRGVPYRNYGGSNGKTSSYWQNGSYRSGMPFVIRKSPDH